MRKLRERQHQVSDRRAAHVKQVQVERERSAGCDAMAVQVGCPKDKRAGPVGEPARSAGQSRWLEHTRIGACGADLALARPRAIGYTRDPLEDGAKRAPQDIGRLSRRKVYRLARHKGKSQRIESEMQAPILCPSVAQIGTASCRG